MEDFIFGLIMGSIGLIIGYYLPRGKKTTTSVIKKIPIHKDHIKPQYYDYHGGYWNVNKCSGCGLIGMYEDLHEMLACPKCGGKVKSFTPGKWGIKDGLRQWISNE